MATAEHVEQNEIWITAAVAAKVLGIYPTKVARFAAKGLIARRQLPGCYPTYRLGDIEELCRNSTTEPSPPRVSTGQGPDRTKAAERADQRLRALGI